MFSKKEDKAKKDVLDVEEFLERVQRDKKLFMEVIEVFVKGFTKKREEIEAAVGRKDHQQIIHLVHGLKGACANIAAKNLRESCLALEQMGMNNDFNAMAVVLERLDRNFKELLGYIAQIKKEI